MYKVILIKGGGDFNDQLSFGNNISDIVSDGFVKENLFIEATLTNHSERLLIPVSNIAMLIKIPPTTSHE